MTNQANTPALQRPAPLDNTKLHSPAVVRKWKEDESAYWAAVRAAEQQAAQEEEAQRAHDNRLLSADEYFALAVERENANRARQTEREAARYADEQQKKEALAASPEVADVLTNNPVEMLREVIHWANRGYTLNPDGPIAMLPPSLWHVQMKKAPAKQARAAEKEAA
jgi:hypothetical protein